MTTVRFATCDRKRALTFLRGHYPSCIVEDTPESASGVLDAVENDIVRIPDPSFHDGTIYPSKNWPSDKSAQKAVIDTLTKFHETTLETKR